MSLLEGHGNSVMNELGREHVAGQARMARVLARAPAERGMPRVPAEAASASSRRCASTRWGRRSSPRSSARPGRARIDAAWRGPEFLPTVDELSRPNDWLARVDGAT